MQTSSPKPIRILIALGFAISCFGLALFLWVAFGGPVPLKPESYRVTVPVTEATQLAAESDVRISGISVGKVKAIELSEDGQADAELELQETYAPLPTDTRAILRQKTLLGETYVELTPGTEGEETIPEGGRLDEAQVAESVQLDEIFRSFDAPTRAAFQGWMQGQAASWRGRGDDVSVALASLEPFAEEVTRALRVLDTQENAVQGFVADGGEVFEALSERTGQLRGLIENSDTVFETTAERNAELEETFRIFPTFLRESRETLARLDEFAQDTNPLITQLRPAAKELTPTLIDLGTLAPSLEGFFKGFARAIDAGKEGLPALRRLVGQRLTPMLKRLDPWLAQFNSILEGARRYRADITALLGNIAASSQGAIAEGGGVASFLRTGVVLGPEAVAAYPRRLRTNRSNAFLAPNGYSAMFDGLSGLPSFETRHCDGGAADPDGIQAVLNPADDNLLIPGNPAESQDLFARIRLYAFGDELNTNDVPAPACTQQGPLEAIGTNPEPGGTQYLHVREQGAP